MRNLKVILILAISLLSFSARADWRAIVQRAGFFGMFAVGVSYEINESHAVDAYLGNYQISKNDYYQVNLSYRYSRWNVPFKGHQWRPLQIGGFVTSSLDKDKYFFRSPDQYPEKNYYDPTATRWGIEFGSTFTFMPWGIGIGYHLRAFDTAFIATFNNSGRDLQYYISSGLSLQYLF